jgi:hypothetical protein
MRYYKGLKLIIYIGLKNSLSVAGYWQNIAIAKECSD